MYEFTAHFTCSTHARSSMLHLQEFHSLWPLQVKCTTRFATVMCENASALKEFRGVR